MSKLLWLDLTLSIDRYDCKTKLLKGVLHLLPQKAPKLPYFLLYIKIIHIFWKMMIYASYSKLSKELKNSITIKVGRTVLELLIQDEHFDCFDL